MPALSTAAIREQLLTNDRRAARDGEIDPPLVVKLFMPYGSGTCTIIRPGSCASA